MKNTRQGSILQVEMIFSFFQSKGAVIWRNSERLHREGDFNCTLNKDQKTSDMLTAKKKAFLVVGDQHKPKGERKSVTGKFKETRRPGWFII